MMRSIFLTYKASTYILIIVLAFCIFFWFKMNRKSSQFIGSFFSKDTYDLYESALFEKADSLIIFIRLNSDKLSEFSLYPTGVRNLKEYREDRSYSEIKIRKTSNGFSYKKDAKNFNGKDQGLSDRVVVELQHPEGKLIFTRIEADSNDPDVNSRNLANATNELLKERLINFNRLTIQKKEQILLNKFAKEKGTEAIIAPLDYNISDPQVADFINKSSKESELAQVIKGHHPIFLQIEVTMHDLYMYPVLTVWLKYVNDTLLKAKPINFIHSSEIGVEQRENNEWFIIGKKGVINKIEKSAANFFKHYIAHKASTTELGKLFRKKKNLVYVSNEGVVWFKDSTKLISSIEYLKTTWLPTTRQLNIINNR